MRFIFQTCTSLVTGLVAVGACVRVWSCCLSSGSHHLGATFAFKYDYVERYFNVYFTMEDHRVKVEYRDSNLDSPANLPIILINNIPLPRFTGAGLFLWCGKLFTKFYWLHLSVITIMSYNL